MLSAKKSNADVNGVGGVVFFLHRFHKFQTYTFIYWRLSGARDFMLAQENWCLVIDEVLVYTLQCCLFMLLIFVLHRKMTSDRVKFVSYVIILDT